jgi:hypothetical protein
VVPTLIRLNKSLFCAFPPSSFDMCDSRAPESVYSSSNRRRVSA